MKKAKLFISILFVLLGVTLSAQNVTVRGTVTDASNGETLPAASVVLKGSTQGVVSDVQGRFSFTVPENGVLLVSMIGYQTAEVSVGGRSTINVALEPDAEFLDEVVVTALGITKSQKAIGYAASTVRSEELTSSRITDAAAAIAGKVAGVQVSNSSTTAGGAQSVIIRGVSSIGRSNQPLYVVDGVPLQDVTVYNTASGYGNLGGGVGALNNDDAM